MTKSLSIIIPAFNEENYLKNCLDAVNAQTNKPTEVIVIDNNSTDRTAQIARSYPFVTLLQEPRQGQVYAQERGFNHTTCDIIARIDADTILGPNWVRDVRRSFQDDPDQIAMTGGGVAYDSALSWLTSFAFWMYHAYVSSFFAGHPLLWGSNCAIKRSAWQQIKGTMSYRRDVWEDFELGFRLAAVGKINYIHRISVGFSLRSGQRSFLDNFEYQYRIIRTFRMFRGRLLCTALFFAWATTGLSFPIMMLDLLLNHIGQYQLGRIALEE